MKDIKRIMLTGGPCSGKTTALAKIGEFAFKWLQRPDEHHHPKLGDQNWLESVRRLR